MSDEPEQPELTAFKVVLAAIATVFLCLIYRYAPHIILGIAVLLVWYVIGR